MIKRARKNPPHPSCRTGAFIGSDAWRQRDVSLFRQAEGYGAKDVPTGIMVTRYRGWTTEPTAQVVAELAHRVRQLTT